MRAASSGRRRARRRRAWPSVATTSTGRGRSSGVVPSRKRPLRQAHVGQQVAVALGLVGQHAGEVLPHQQAGDRRWCRRRTGCRPARRARRRGPARRRSGASTRAPNVAGEDRRPAPAVTAAPGAAGPGAARGPAVRLVARRRIGAASAQAKKPASDAGGVARLARGARARRCGPCRCRPRASGSPRRRRPPGTGGRRAGSTRRRRTRGGGRAPRRNTSCQSSTQSTTAAASARVCGRMRGLGVVPADAERHDAQRRQLRVRGRARRRACRRARRRR